MSFVTPPRLYGLLLIILFAVGCGSGGVYVQTSLHIEPQPLVQTVGEPFQLSVSATYSDGGTRDVTSLVGWRSTTPAIASLDTKGLLTCNTAGQTTITASLVSSSNNATVTCSAFRLSVSAAASTLLVSHSLQLNATASYSNGNTADLTDSAGWSTSASLIATISNKGSLTCKSTGVVQVSATVQMVSATYSISCKQSLITISGLPPVAVAGQPVQLRATSPSATGVIIDVTQTSIWSSDNPGVATIGKQGLVTCISAGAGVVYAATPEASGSAQITCVIPQIAVSGAEQTTFVNQSRQLTATAALSDGIRFDVTLSAVWSSQSPSVAQVGMHGLVVCKTVGSASVTANANGATGSALVRCSSSKLAISGISPLQYVDHPVQLHATDNLSNGTISDVTNDSTWSSASPAVATVSNSGLLNCVASGSTQILARSGVAEGSAQANCSALQLSISGIPAFLLVGHSARLTAQEHSSDGTTKDVSNSTTWSSNPTMTATITSDGTLTCNAAGTTLVTATATNIMASDNVTCSTAPTSLSIVPSSVSTRVGEPVTVAAIARYSDGQQIDVSSSALWQGQSSILSFGTQGVLLCNTAGVTTFSASYLGITQTAPVSCSPPSLNTPSYFTEASDEFAGPFPSWTDVKAVFGAVGDGHADDTAAIQKALDSLNTPGASAVLWFPAGTYNTTGLVITHKVSFSLIGENPTTTHLRWIGGPHGTILTTDGSTDYKITRLTFDGADVADTAENLDSTTTGGYYQSFLELSDQHIIGVKYGIRLPRAAETTVERVFFDNLTEIAFSSEDWNTLNIFVNDSLFLNCGTGLSNTLGAGAFVVSNSYFKGSAVADMSIRNTGYYTARHNTSVGSKAFFVAEDIGANPSQLTIQNNTILDPAGPPFYIGDLGPMMLIDNIVRFTDSTTPYLQSDWDPSALPDLFTFGNTYTPNGGTSANNGRAFPGRTDSYDDSITSVTAIPDVRVPENVYIPPNLHRSIFEVADFTGTAVQRAIDQAVQSGSASPVVHLASGVYHTQNTIVFPEDSSVQLIGDDSNTTILMWDGSVGGTLLQIPTSNVSVKNVGVFSASTDNAADGILLKLHDQPNMQVIADQAQLQGGNQYAVNFDGIEHVTAELFSTYTMGSITGVNVLAGPFRAAREATLGVTNHYTGSLQSQGTSTSFSVDHFGKFMVQDNWHDTGLTSPRNFILSGSGTVTEQGGLVGMSSDIPFELDGFDGDVSLIGLEFRGGFKLASGDKATNLFNLSLLSDNPSQPVSIGNVTVNNLFSSYYNGAGVHIPHQDSPGTAWLRHMLAQSRTEFPIQRLPLKPGAHRIRLSRIEARNMLSAVHVLSDQPPSGLYYTVSTASQLLATSGTDCPTTTPNATALGTHWVLLDAGDGDYEIIPAGGHDALGFTTLPDGTNSELGLTLFDGSYRQRWLIQNRGDGDFDIRNRQTGLVLTRPDGAGCISMGLSTDPRYSGWTISAH